MWYHRGNPNDGSVTWTRYEEIWENTDTEGNSVQACECLDEAKIKKSKQQKRPQRENLKECEDLKLICPQCKPSLLVISDEIYLCLSCGKQGCKKHFKECHYKVDKKVDKNECDSDIVHVINTKKMRCLECNLVHTPDVGETLFKRYYAECLHLRQFFSKDTLPEDFKVKSPMKICDKCCHLNLPEKKFLVCLMCGVKICCVVKAKQHNLLFFNHYLSLEISTQILHCHNCQKEFSRNQYSDVSTHGEFIKEHCELILQQVFIMATSSSPKPLPLHNTECLHIKFFSKGIIPEDFKVKSPMKICDKCRHLNLPEKKFLVCLMCGVKICCVVEAKQHNLLFFNHFLSLDNSTKILHCHSCQKEFSRNQYSDVSTHGEFIKEHCELILQQVFIMTTSSSPKPLPLHNTGNICYFITVVQNLRNCTQLINYYSSMISEGHFKQVYEIRHENVEKPIEVDCEVKPFTAAVLSVLNATNQNELQMSAQDLLNLIRQRNEMFTVGTQQDSHEVLRLILNELKEDEIDNVKSVMRNQFSSSTSGGTSADEEDNQLQDYLRQALKIQTVVDKVFGGKIVNTVVCRECHNVLQLVESQLDYSLPISDEISTSKKETEEDPSIPFTEDQSKLRTYLKDHKFHYQYIDKECSYDQFTIEQCLESFTTLDVLDEDNKFICDKCYSTKDETLCSKQLLIHALPQILVLHLKRFNLHPKLVKNNRHIGFPLVLNMAPFCTNGCFEIITPGSGDMEEKIMYALKGVIVHRGGLHYGHYYTYLRTTTTKRFSADCERTGYYNESASLEGNWYCANDSRITYVSKAHEGIPIEVSNASGYLLFYEQLPLKSSNNDD